MMQPCSKSDFFNNVNVFLQVLANIHFNPNNMFYKRIIKLKEFVYIPNFYKTSIQKSSPRLFHTISSALPNFINYINLHGKLIKKCTLLWLRRQLVSRKKKTLKVMTVFGAKFSRLLNSLRR